MRLPRTLVFPFNYRVAVKQVTRTEIIDINEGEDADALWDVETRTIYLSKQVPLRRRRACLIHEMMHALADFQHQMMDDGVARN